MPEWRYVEGSQLGTNPGGKFIGPDNKMHYAKFYENNDQAKAEFLANDLFAKLGLGAPKTMLKKLPWQGKEKFAVVTEWIDDTVPIKKFVGKKLTDLQQEQIAKHYLGAALNANWDAVGFEFDNLVRAGRTWRCIDQGGSFMFRARGARKAYGPVVDELDSLLSPGRKAGQVFNPVLGETIHKNPDHYIEWIEGLTDKKIKSSIATAGFGADLSKTIIQRRNYIADHLRRLEKAEPGVFFKSKVHNEIYEELIKEYEGLTALEIRGKLKYECATTKAILDEWQGSTQGLRPVAYKYKAELMETKPLKTYVSHKFTKSDLLAGANNIPDKEYIRIRAMTQAYYKTKGVKTMKLYRGTDGGKAGPEYRKKVEEIRRKYPTQWKNMTIDLTETSLVGYSESETIGATFGYRARGFTVARDVPVEDIFLPHELWPKKSYLQEQESLVFGFPGMAIKLSDIII